MFRLKGPHLVLWHQGESRRHAAVYCTLLAVLVSEPQKLGWMGQTLTCCMCCLLTARLLDSDRAAAALSLTAVTRPSKNACLLAS